MNNELIKKEAYPIIFKILADAELQLTELTGLRVRLNMEVDKGEALSEKEALKLRLQLLVCSAFNISWGNVVSRSRTVKLVDARRCYSYICCEILKYSTKEVGRDMYRDHSSAIYLRDTCKNLIDANDPLALIVNNVKIKLYENTH